MTEPTHDTALSLVSRVPRTVSEMYREWAGVPENSRLTVSQRRTRKRLGAMMEHLARRREVHREVVGHEPDCVVLFWRD